VGKKDAGLTDGVGIDWRCLRWCRALTSDFSISAASQVEKGKRGEGGGPGLLIGGLSLGNKLGFVRD
jgi:hypothetical protein